MKVAPSSLRKLQDSRRQGSKQFYRPNSDTSAAPFAADNRVLLPHSSVPFFDASSQVGWAVIYLHARAQRRAKDETGLKIGRAKVPLSCKAKHIQMLEQIYKVAIYLLETRLFTIKVKITGAHFLAL